MLGTTCDTIMLATKQRLPAQRVNGRSAFRVTATQTRCKPLEVSSYETDHPCNRRRNHPVHAQGQHRRSHPTATRVEVGRTVNDDGRTRKSEVSRTGSKWVYEVVTFGEIEMFNYAHLRLSAWQRMMNYTPHTYGRYRYAKLCIWLDARSRKSA